MPKNYAKLLAICFFSCSSFLFSITPEELLEENIPNVNDEASKVISFSATKNPSELSLRTDLLSMIKKNFGVEAFIETGTHFGDTTRTAAHIFSQVISIESSSQLYQRACRQLLSYDNVALYQGNAASILTQILPNLSKKTLFYLNSHYNKDLLAGEAVHPVLTELDTIKSAEIDSPIILISDVHSFQNSLYAQSGDEFLNLKQLVESILAIDSTYQICFLGDTLLAYPKDPTICVTPVVRACSIHRLSIAFPEFSEKTLLEADKVISRVAANERKELQTYYIYSWGIAEMDQGLRSFAALWCGLVLINDGKLEEAIMLLTHAANNSMSNWRINTVLQSVVIPGSKTKNYKI